MTATTTTSRLSLVALIALVMGNMVGSGVFLLPATLAQFGSIGLFSWIFTACGALILALMFAALSAHLPGDGGPYRYCMLALGPKMAFVVAYNYWLAMWIGNAAIIVALVGYVSVFFPVLETAPVLSFMLALVVLWGITLVNMQGIQEAAALQIVLTVLKALPLLVVIFVGFHWFRADYLQAFNVTNEPSYAVFSQAAALTLWSFIGLESATIPSSNVDNPQIKIPLATILGTLGAAGLYIGSATMVMGMLPSSELQHSVAPYADACRVFMGPWGEKFIALGAIVACLGTLNGWVLLQGKMPQVMAEDGFFPKIFRQTNSKQAPYVGLVVSSLLITALLSLNLNSSLAQTFTYAIALATLATLFPYFLTAISAIKLFVHHQEKFSKCRLMVYLLIAAMGCCYSFWMITSIGFEFLQQGVLLALTGVPIYFLIRRGF